MKKLNLSNKLTSLLLALWATFMAGLGQVMAQQPSNLPPADTDPLGFFESTTNIIVFIILPVVIIILFGIWRHKTNKMQKRKQQEKEDEKADDKSENI